MLSESNLKILPWIVGLGLFIENIDITVINTSLPEIAKSLHCDPLDLKIGITSYLLTLAVFIPISGYIADRIGTKKTFSLAILIFMLGSTICGFSHNINMLIIGRLIQGAGGAIMAPVGRLILVKIFPRSEFVKAFSYVVIVGQFGTAIGPILGGLITNFFHWRYIFFLNIPIGLAALGLINLIMKNSRSDNIAPFDHIGFMLFGMSTSLIILPLTLLTQRAPVNNLEYYLLVLGIVLFYIYYLHFKKTSYPAVDLSLLKIRTYRLAAIGTIITRIGLGGIPFMLPLLFQLDFKLSVLESSLLLLPYGIGFISAKLFLKRILNYFGFKKSLLINGLCISVVLILFGFVNSQTNKSLLDCLIFTLGALSSMQLSYMSVLNYVDVESQRLSKATSLSSVIQQISLGLGVCLVAGFLAIFDPIIYEDNFIPFFAFEYVFFILSFIVLLSLICFARLRSNDGNSVLKRPVFESKIEEATES